MKPKLLFIFDHKFPHLWRDGLWAALELLKSNFEISKYNIQQPPFKLDSDSFDFVLGWGAFGSPVDLLMRSKEFQNTKKGLCIGGTPTTATPQIYNVLFYETEWFRQKLGPHSLAIHAFGVNTEIYNHQRLPKIWDWLTVGAFAYWKRQHRIIEKPGTKLAIGEVQKNNPVESGEVLHQLFQKNVMVSDMVPPETLAKIYNASENVIIPADVNGGGERAVLEALACGCKVFIEPDNPKLAEVLNSPKNKMDMPMWDHHYYAAQLKQGIQSAL